MRTKNIAAAIVIATALAANTLPAVSAEANRAVSISSILPISNVRPAQPETQSIIRVYFASAPFGTLNCRTDAADIALEDWHLYSTIMSGWRDGKTVTVYVDDNAHLVPGDVACRIVAARVQ